MDQYGDMDVESLFPGPESKLHILIHKGAIPDACMSYGGVHVLHLGTPMLFVKIWPRSSITIDKGENKE